MLLLQDKTLLPLMLRLSTLGCQTTVYCSSLPFLLAPRQLSNVDCQDIRLSPLAFSGHNDFRSAVLSALCLPNGLHCLDPDMMASLHNTTLNTILDHAIPVRTVTRHPFVATATFQHCHLRSVLNAAARLIHRSSRHEHVTPLLRDLNWLRSRERIGFKSVVLVYRCLHGLIPRHLSLIISNMSSSIIADDFVHHHHHRRY